MVFKEIFTTKNRVGGVNYENWIDCRGQQIT